MRSRTAAPCLLVLGGGAVVSELYVPALTRLGWIDRTVVAEPMDVAVEALTRANARLRVERRDYRSILDDPQAATYDGVVVAVPNHLHEDATVRSLEKGLHVLCEKPLAGTSEACLRVAREAAARGRILSVAMVRRLIPAVAALRRALTAGLIGEVRDIDVQHGGRFAWPTQSGHYFRKEHGGIFLNMGVHYLDMLEDLVGPLFPHDYRDDWAGGVEANCDCRLVTGSGATVRIRLSYTHALRNLITVSGTAGAITVDVNRFDSAMWSAPAAGLGGALHAVQPFADDAWPLDFVSSFAQQFVEFADAIQGRAVARVAAPQAAATLRLIEWAYDHRRPLVSAPAVARKRPTLEPGPALVTGGTGFVGVRLLERLTSLGFRDVRVAIRSHRSGASAARFPVDCVVANLLDPASVDAVTRGARYVFHLAYGTDGDDADRVTVEGTRNVVESAIRSGCQTVVVVSTTSVFGHPPSGPVDESFPYGRNLSEYARAKAAAERYCLRRAASARPTRIVVVNPASVYGPGGALFTEYPVRACRDGSFAWVGDGRGTLNYTFVDNVVDALVLAAAKDDVAGQRFIISDGATSVREFLLPLIGAFEDRPRSFSEPELEVLTATRAPGVRDFLRVLAGPAAMDLVNRTPVLARSKRLVQRAFSGTFERVRQLREESLDRQISEPPGPLPPSWLADVFGPRGVPCTSERARTRLGWQPLVDRDEGLRVSLEWLEFLDLAPTAPPTAAAAGVEEAEGVHT